VNFVVVDKIVDKGQPAGFTANGAAADSGKTPFWIKSIFIEISDDSALTNGLVFL
jgi:hypothetical protein